MAEEIKWDPAMYGEFMLLTEKNEGIHEHYGRIISQHFADIQAKKDELERMVDEQSIQLLPLKLSLMEWENRSDLIQLQLKELRCENAAQFEAWKQKLNAEFLAKFRLLEEAEAKYEKMKNRKNKIVKSLMRYMVRKHSPKRRVTTLVRMKAQCGEEGLIRPVMF